MNIEPQKRMAAEILKCGINRIYVHPNYIEEVLLAITREDIRNLIKNHIIQKRPESGISRARANERLRRKQKGLSRGYGKRKGKKSARQKPKQMWINQIRSQRRELKKLRDTKKIDVSTYRKLYMKAKGNAFDSIATMHRYINENKLWRN